MKYICKYTFTHFEKYSSKLDISRSFVRIFERDSQYTITRFEKYSSKLDISRSFVRIFAKNLPTDMKIGYDAKRAVNNNTGLGNYSRLVIETIADSGDDTLMLYAPALRNNPRLMPLLERENVTLCLPDTKSGKRFSSIWRSSGLSKQLQRDEIELFHGLSNELPLNIASSGIPSIVTIHDVIFRHFPHCYNWIDRKIYDYKFRKAAENATRVIAISECTRRDIINLYNINPDKIDVVYQGCDPQFSRPVDRGQVKSVMKKYGIDRDYIIGVGTVEERKNQLLTVKALRGLPKDVIAVIVGRRTGYAKEIDAYISSHKLQDRVKFIEKADFADFPALYSGALFSSYPSRYEGFGIPVIESLSVGTPVIIASGSCLEEAAGPDAPVVAPDDVDGFIAAADSIIHDENNQMRLSVLGKKYVQRFSQQYFAEDLRECYKRTVETFER